MSSSNRVLVALAAAAFAFVAMAELLSTLDIESNRISACAAVIIGFVTWSLTRSQSGPASAKSTAITPGSPHYGDRA